MSRIRLSPTASVAPTGAGVILRSDLSMFRLDGSDMEVFVQAMLPLLNGAHDADEVAGALSEYSRESVLAFLQLMKTHGLIEEVPDDFRETTDERWRGQQAFLREWGEAGVRRSLQESRLLVAGLEPWGAVAVSQLAASGVGSIDILDDGIVRPEDVLWVRDWGPGDIGKNRGVALSSALERTAPWCRLTVTSDMSPDVMADGSPNRWDVMLVAAAEERLALHYRLATWSQASGLVALWTHLHGLEAGVGPLVVPGRTACWNCWRLRSLGTSDHPDVAHAIQSSLLETPPPERLRTYLGPMPSTLGHLAALETIKLLTGYTQSALAGRVLVQNLVTLETARHAIIRMPWCDVCGGAGRDGDASGGEEPSSPPIDGIDEPSALRSALQGWVDERTGVVRALVVNEPDIRDPQLPVTATAVLARYTEGAAPRDPSEVGTGKGLTAVEAMRGAVGEAIERYSASRIDRHSCRRALAAELDGDYLSPTALALYDDEQYAQEGFPFDQWGPEQPIDWVGGRWLDTSAPVWVPALPVYFNYPAPHGERFCQVTSSGLAAGRDLDDATLRATLELLERDAFMLTWLCRRPGQRIVPDDSVDPTIREAIRQLGEVGAHIELYLVDSGVDVPTVVCLGLGDGAAWPGATVSLSAHLSPRRAVRQAVLEQGHVGPHIRRIARQGEQRIPSSPDEVVDLMDHALYYVPAERVEAFDFLRAGDTRSVALHDLTEPNDLSLQALVGRLGEANLRIAAMDVTAPDVARGPLRVVRALGENIQPIDFGYRFRRLNNPRLRNLATSSVNPFPHPLA